MSGRSTLPSASGLVEMKPLVFIPDSHFAPTSYQDEDFDLAAAQLEAGEFDERFKAMSEAARNCATRNLSRWQGTIEGLLEFAELTTSWVDLGAALTFLAAVTAGPAGDLQGLAAAQHAYVRAHDGPSFDRAAAFRNVTATEGRGAALREMGRAAGGAYVIEEGDGPTVANMLAGAAVGAGMRQQLGDETADFLMAVPAMVLKPWWPTYGGLFLESLENLGWSGAYELCSTMAAEDEA